MANTVYLLLSFRIGKSLCMKDGAVLMTFELPDDDIDDQVPTRPGVVRHLISLEVSTVNHKLLKRRQLHGRVGRPYLRLTADLRFINNQRL
jgi:hypothetical protein